MTTGGPVLPAMGRRAAAMRGSVIMESENDAIMKLQEAEAEIARLRAALEEIASWAGTTTPDKTALVVLLADINRRALAALPPDWCGHAEQALDSEAFIGRQQAEIAHLRRIEELAVNATRPWITRWEQAQAIVALRAELEDEKP